MAPPTIHDRLRDAQARFRASGITEPEATIDAELLARHVLGWTREQMIVRWLEPATPEFERRYALLVRRREAREPVAYLIGRREFWGLDFEVTRDVLIPRPETELIVEEALALVRPDHRSSGHRPSGASPRTETAADGAPGDDGEGLGGALTIVDVGTGSGCLAVALAHELPRARLIAIDVSTAALHVAMRNADRHGVATRIAWHAGSLLEPIDRAVDLIVSNPPYVPLREAAALPPDVREYEPGVALFSGEDGLATIRALLAQAADRVRPGGWLIFEFGFGQAEAIRDLVTAATSDAADEATCDRSPIWDLVRLREDLQGIPRTAVLRRR